MTPRGRGSAARGKATVRKMADIERPARDRCGEVHDTGLFQPETPAEPELLPGTIGQDLRKAREHNGITPEAIWRDLKIPPHHLAAIEAGCFEGLPGRVYAVGFVR